MADLDARYFELGRVFRPHAPIDEARLFAGRRDQIADMLDAIFQTGRHAILYGERGVGKTSLAKVFHGFMGDDTEFHVPYVTCDHSDDYSTVWHKLLLPD